MLFYKKVMFDGVKKATDNYSYKKIVKCECCNNLINVSESYLLPYIMVKKLRAPDVYGHCPVNPEIVETLLKQENGGNTPICIECIPKKKVPITFKEFIGRKFKYSKAFE